jgi:hypothetical protein
MRRWLALVLFSVPVCQAQNQQAGAVYCPMPFQVDGVAVSNSATVFPSNRLDAGDALCTFQRTGGDTVDFAAHSEIVITPAGVVLIHGSLRIKGPEVLAIPSVSPNIRPAPQSVIEAQFANGEWTVDVVRGSAQLTGAVLYAELDSNTRMRFFPDSNQASGVDLLLEGCAREEQGQWFLDDTHIRRSVELLGNSVAGKKKRVEIKGGVAQLDPNPQRLAARIQVISETATDKRCGFDPKLIPVILGLSGGAAYGISTLSPGSSSTPVSIP